MAFVSYCLILNSPYGASVRPYSCDCGISWISLLVFCILSFSREDHAIQFSIFR